MSAGDRITSIGAAIRRYLASHPKAADSATGIGQWWLTGLGFEAGPVEVQAALDALIESGELHVAIQADGSRLYRGTTAEVRSSTVSSRSGGV